MKMTSVAVSATSSYLICRVGSRRFGECEGRGSSGGWRSIEGNEGSIPMTPAAASIIQSAAAISGGGGVQKGSFASRAQSASAKNVNQEIVTSPSSGGGGSATGSRSAGECEGRGGSPSIGEDKGSTPYFMIPAAASLLQSVAAHNGGGRVKKGSFASRAQSEAAKNVNKGIVT
eukprot:TRINITY_DN154_c0_g1_i2.p1 TRINITY_DN154_c0_g1~~TRINITY_DN154_c0_g1_i2.p1  ORF type:complete len:174 (-),score=17.39 TRINITY_DN154_c0_g1_i2:202-723(-)